MAGDWVPFRVGLSREPEVLAIARSTGRSRHEVAGLLGEFWGWLSEVSGDAKVTLECQIGDARVTQECVYVTLTEAVGGDVALWKAVDEVGWIRIDDRGNLTIPNPDRWNSHAAKLRLQHRIRQKRYKEAHAEIGAETGDAKVTQKRRKQRHLSVTTEQESTSSPPTPSNEGARDAAHARHGKDEDPAEKAWQQVLDLVPEHDPSIRNPVAWVKSLRAEHATPAEAGIDWLEEAQAKRDRAAALARVKRHVGRSIGQVRVLSAGVDDRGSIRSFASMPTAALVSLAEQLETPQ